MPIEIPSSYDRVGPQYTGFEGLGDLPKPAGPVVPRASIKTLDQARDYARAGYAASAQRADKKTVARQAWIDAAKKYAEAHTAVSAAGIITASTSLSVLSRVLEFLKAADALADSAKRMDLSSSPPPTFDTGGGSAGTPAQQYPMLPLPSEGGGMGLPLKIGIAGGIGFALLALFGRSKKDTKGASRLMGFLEGNRTRRRKMTKKQKAKRARKGRSHVVKDGFRMLDYNRKKRRGPKRRGRR